jgi:hypothetical protein
MPTIFESVVTKENDHTNLLRNIMERHPRAASAILSYLLGRSVSEVEAASLEFRTQHSFSGVNGREIPDILVEGHNFRCIIEAKVDPALDLTSGQRGGYQACLTGGGERHLCFLVPNDWRHASSVEQVSALLNDSVSVHISHWRELVSKLEEISRPLTDEVLNEAIRFWKWSFKLEPMTPEEKQSLNTWSKEKYSAIRKLGRTISQAKGLFDARDARSFDTELETSDINSYAFYIKRGGSYLLWIGIWTKSSTPLSFGFDRRSAAWNRPLNPPLAPIKADPYDLWPLDSEAWDKPEKIYTAVKSFLESYPTV